jgi:hypothetical protein
MGRKSLTNLDKLKAEFLETFRNAEYTLKRSGFNKPVSDRMEADWDGLANALGTTFFQLVVKNGTAITLIGNPPRKHILDPVSGNATWNPKTTAPLKNVQELIVMGVCRVRNNFFHGEKFIGGDPGDWLRGETLLSEALSVLKFALEYLVQPNTNIPASLPPKENRRRNGSLARRGRSAPDCE